jgi:hypothetical protein
MRRPVASERLLTKNKMPAFDQCVCPLWVLERGKPDLIGSGTLLRVEQTKFLITAAHVIDCALNQALLVGNSSGFRQIGGFGKLTLPVSGSRQADRNDTAVIELDEDTASFIEDAKALLPIRCADANDSFSPGKPYAFFGYPWRKVRSVKSRTLFESRIYKFQSGSVAEIDYASLGLCPHKHIAVEFDLKRVVDGNGRAIVAPNPEGMSGGPVWSFIPVDLDGQKMWTRRLVGIAIEYRLKTRTFIGVRINAALECIRMTFPNLSPCIPANPELAVICRDHFHG